MLSIVPRIGSGTDADPYRPATFDEPDGRTDGVMDLGTGHFLAFWADSATPANSSAFTELTLANMPSIRAMVGLPPGSDTSEDHTVLAATIITELGLAYSESELMALAARVKAAEAA